MKNNFIIRVTLRENKEDSAQNTGSKLAKNSYIEKALITLKNYFDDDHEAVSAVNTLEEKIDEQGGYEAIFQDLNEGQSSDSPGTEEFPLPKELIQLQEGEEGVALFSDGACRGNPGPGAYGMMAQNTQSVLLFEGSSVELMTTNNKMELQGAISALLEFDRYRDENGLGQDVKVFLYTDSQYVVKGVNSWMSGWKRRNWKKSDNKVPENVDLWKELDRVLALVKNVRVIWVKGHAGHPQNEYCDQLANMALDQIS